MSTQESPKVPGLPAVDMNEYGGKRDGERQAMNRRLFMQLLTFDAPSTWTRAPEEALLAELQKAKVPSVVYADASAVRGAAVLTWAEDPAHFVDVVRPVLRAESLVGLEERRAFAMLGRTYSTGHEPDLEHVLLHRSIQNVMHPEYGWHVWYPLRRIGAFSKVEAHEQSMIMREHAAIGMAYGQGEYAHDVRLACHGLDASDNEFVIGLVGRELHPLSHLVQTMRKTRQTSEFMEKMGPFFVGRVAGRVKAG